MIYKRLRHSAAKSRIKPKKWTKILENEPCFILGNGPSLIDENIHVLQDKYFTIGINSSCDLFDSTLLMWQDVEFFYSKRKILPNLKSILFCRDSSDPLNLAYHFTLSNGNFILPRNASILNGRGSSGPLAFELAYVLGCNPIVLLGFDCRHRDGKTDFYGINRFHKSHTMNSCKKGLKWIRDCQFDRKVINCSDNSVFPERRKLIDVLEELKKAHVYRSRKYFTVKMIDEIE